MTVPTRQKYWRHTYTIIRKRWTIPGRERLPPCLLYTSFRDVEDQPQVPAGLQGPRTDSLYPAWREDPVQAVSYTHLDVYKRQALGWFTNSVQRPHILEEIKKMQQTANLPEDLKAELEPVSYTHLQFTA